MARYNTPALDSEYKYFKSLAHISVWLNKVMASLIKQEHLNKDKEELLLIKSHLSILKTWNSELKKNEEEVIDSVLLLIDRLLLTTSVMEIRNLRTYYLDAMIEPNKRYAQLATELQLQGMHRLMLSWQRSYQLNLENTRVLIVCAHGPKELLIEMQYFLNIYDQYGITIEKARGYVIPVTMLEEQIATLKQTQLIAFLRRYILNASIGREMLHDENAMYKDVLGPYAPAVLKTLTLPLYHTISHALKSFSLFADKKADTDLKKSPCPFHSSLDALKRLSPFNDHRQNGSRRKCINIHQKIKD